MPFSSLGDPADIARAYAAWDAIWEEVAERIPDAHHDREKRRIAYLIVEFAPMALDEEDLKRNVLLRLSAVSSGVTRPVTAR
ncbi:hypothetical protein ACXIUS_09055 [Bosea thiooxidans]|jgi:hypothetical protein|nr:hypothetical protein [Bosea sp. (in: a-proteobacteria)]